MSRRKKMDKPAPKTLWRAGLYMRLSREDGDKPESDSISNQRALLERAVGRYDGMEIAGTYTDDGFTGTNFDRPDFRRMIGDIESGKVNCVIVKDLSRFGRDYIDVGRYLERWFPDHDVRFIAVNDNIDSENGPYDMLLPVKNVFNEQYARDISRKVRSAMRTKQQQGEFIGAFASYGYRKDPADRNRLVVDPAAAEIVKRIFALFEQGNGKLRIAKLLNQEGIPCPSEYKRLNGERYHNGQRVQNTTYWTYATVHRILRNQMYIGNMEQGRAPRQTIHGRAKQLDRDRWTVVEGTHEAIIGSGQWARVQSLLEKNARTLNFEQNVSPFAGFLRCGDCGRAMSKTNRPGGVSYCCGSYKRYGPTVCSCHGISHRELEQIVLDDLNRVIAAVGDLRALAEQSVVRPRKRNLEAERARVRGGLDRLYRLKKSAYEDYREKLIGKEDYLRYKADYERQETQLTAQLELLREPAEEDCLCKPWVEALIRHGGLTGLDRATVAETIKRILIFEDRRVEITYSFSDDLGILEERGAPS